MVITPQLLGLSHLIPPVLGKRNLALNAVEQIQQYLFGKKVKYHMSLLRVVCEDMVVWSDGQFSIVYPELLPALPGAGMVRSLTFIQHPAWKTQRPVEPHLHLEKKSEAGLRQKAAFQFQWTICHTQRHNRSI